MGEAENLREALRLLTKQRWSPARVAALMKHLPPKEALAAAQRVARLQKWLDNARGRK